VVDAVDDVTGSNSIGLLSEIQGTRGMQFRETPGDYAFDWCDPLSNRVQSILYYVLGKKPCRVFCERAVRRCMHLDAMWFVIDSVEAHHRCELTASATLVGGATQAPGASQAVRGVLGRRSADRGVQARG
jgi:hypothetical protein